MMYADFPLIPILQNNDEIGTLSRAIYALIQSLATKEINLRESKALSAQKPDKHLTIIRQYCLTK